jgi:hypothetical protein
MNEMMPSARQMADFAMRYELPSYIFGLVMLVVILMVHGTLLGRLSLLYVSQTHKYLHSNRLMACIVVFYFSIIGLVVTHLIEIMLWGLALFKMQLFTNLPDAVLFAGSTYTTLGFYSDVLPIGWKMTIIIISFSGMFCFAWTTSLLIDMIKGYRSAQLHLYLAKHPKQKTLFDPLASNQNQLTSNQDGVPPPY